MWQWPFRSEGFIPLPLTTINMVVLGLFRSKFCVPASSTSKVMGSHLGASCDISPSPTRIRVVLAV